MLFVIKYPTKTKQSFATYKFYMFENLGHLLPPLNFWDKGKVTLDPWQEKVIQMIKNNKSVIVRAPTSSGKTFILLKIRTNKDKFEKKSP